MPNVNPNAKVVAPGVTTTPNAYPQWGVKQVSSGGSADYSITEAASAAQKQADLGQGYAIWFSSQAAAQSYVSSENSALNGNLGSVPGISGVSSVLNVVKDIYGTLTSSNLWIRVAKVIVGGALVIIGLAHITGASNAVAQAARKAPLPV